MKIFWKQFLYLFDEVKTGVMLSVVVFKPSNLGNIMGLDLVVINPDASLL